MEFEFDNEIDALLRNEGHGRTITISEFAGPHIDADELSMFAEGVVPEKLRPAMTAHLSDCDECRKLFTSYIEIVESAGAETVPALSAVSGRSENKVSERRWFAGIFSMPALAYGMGALVVLFSGFIAYTVLYNGVGSTGSLDTVSQVSNTAGITTSTLGSGESESVIGNVNASTQQDNSSEIAKANTVSPLDRQTPAKPSGRDAQKIDSAAGRSTDFVVDGADITAVRPPPPAPVAAEAAKPADLPMPAAATSRPDDKSSVQTQDQAPSAGNMANTQAGPSRSVQRDNRIFEDKELAKKRSASAPAGIADPPSRRAGGKSFSKRQNVWYDSLYTGQPTTNIRRSSSEYRSLDRGLRSIAESLDGVVVVIWRSRAYRIQ